MVKGCSATEHRIRMKLEEELDRLKRATGFGSSLVVRWVPDEWSKLSGVVRDEVIYVHEENESEALKTLRHEFVDYLVSQAIEPYKAVTNALIKMINEDAYTLKEKVVEALTRRIKENDGS